MDNEEFVYGSANRMLRKAMREYGVKLGAESQVDQFGIDWGAIGTGIVQGAQAIGNWAKDNPETVAKIGAASVQAVSAASKTESKGRNTTRKAKKAQKVATKYDEALVTKVQQYIGEYTTMLGEMRRQLTENGILDPNAQNEVARNAFAAELYDNPPSDTIKKNVLKMLIIRMDKNLKKAYNAKSRASV